MPIKGSGSLAMSEINSEFGRGNNLNAYRGTFYYMNYSFLSTGYFPSSSISFNNFYSTRASRPYTYPDCYCWFNNYGSYGYFHLQLSNGNPYSSWGVRLYYNSAGLPVNPPGQYTSSGTLDGNGNFYQSYYVTDAYWFPAPRVNAWQVYQDGNFVQNISASS